MLIPSVASISVQAMLHLQRTATLVIDYNEPLDVAWGARSPSLTGCMKYEVVVTDRDGRGYE